MRYIRGIVISPETQTVSEIYLEPSLEGMRYALAGADQHFGGMVERVSVSDYEDLWLDEEGCLSPGRAVFQLGSGTFSGSALILAHDDEGDSIASKLPLDLIITMVKWTTLETTGEFGEPREYVTDHPVFGPNTPVFEGGKPIYQQKAL